MPGGGIGDPSTPPEQRGVVTARWKTMLEKFYTELAKSGVEVAEVNMRLWGIKTLDQLVAEFETFDSNSHLGDGRFKFRSLLGRLESLRDFASVVASRMSMNGKVQALLWGSIQFIVKVHLSPCDCLHSKVNRASNANGSRPTLDSRLSLRFSRVC